jgi:predicted nucleotidyltransferase
MRSRIEIENKLKEIKPVLYQKYFVDKIGYFGSFSRDETFMIGLKHTRG